MSGLRLHHPTKTSCVLIVPHPGGNGRLPKDYRITLDANGDVIVSTVIWQRLEEARAAGWPHGLIVSNVVGEPPKQVLDMRARRRVPLAEHRIARN